MQGTSVLFCAPGVPHPDQFHRHYPRDIVTVPVDIFLAAVGQQIPKGLVSWGCQN